MSELEFIEQLGYDIKRQISLKISLLSIINLKCGFSGKVTCKFKEQKRRKLTEFILCQGEIKRRLFTVALLLILTFAGYRS